MITKIWLKSQPNKCLEYPECYPIFGRNIEDKEPVTIVYMGKIGCNAAEYLLSNIVRIEFRPS